MDIKQIAHIQSPYGQKFGIPKQAGLADEVRARIVFRPEYGMPDTLRGLEGFSHIWLLWGFSACEEGKWSPTVRPPVLGGNTHMGVFATRSPFRPNSIGLSAVEVIGIFPDPKGKSEIIIKGADLMDGTPIFDIKPYLPYCDSIPEASSGFTADLSEPLEVVFCSGTAEKLEQALVPSLIQVLSLDPRPAYHDDGRTYRMSFSGHEIAFCVTEKMLKVLSVD